MPVEDFLRSLKLVKTHIARTRRLTHENTKYRKFIEENGLSPADVIDDKTKVISFLQIDDEGDAEENIALSKIKNALLVERRQRKLLEAEIYILRQDYHKAMADDESELVKKGQSKV